MKRKGNNKERQLEIKEGATFDHNSDRRRYSLFVDEKRREITRAKSTTGKAPESSQIARLAHVHSMTVHAQQKVFQKSFHS